LCEHPGSLGAGPAWAAVYVVALSVALGALAVTLLRRRLLV